eukprot:1991431-Rhodomonas_salina.1
MNKPRQQRTTELIGLDTSEVGLFAEDKALGEDGDEHIEEEEPREDRRHIVQRISPLALRQQLRR